ncbi:MAG: hypothetical protein WB392_04275 [Methanotrichaceae archaeon]
MTVASAASTAITASSSRADIEVSDERISTGVERFDNMLFVNFEGSE